MNTHEFEKNMQMFEIKYLHDITSEVLKMTQENMATSINPRDTMSAYMIKEKPSPDKNETYLFKKTESRLEQNNRQQYSKTKKHNKLYNLQIKKLIVEIVVGYTLTIGFMYLNKVAYFPFFEALMIIIIALSTKSPKNVNYLILLTIPMAIANYNLGVWVLTYPEIIICYFSTYAFTQHNFRGLFWIFTTVVTALFGFIFISKIGQTSQMAQMVLYYIFPFLLAIVKLFNAIINEFLPENTLFLLQVPFYLTGLCYGIILTLNKSNVQFWYLLILLSMQIINTRYQFMLRLILQMANIKYRINIAQAHSSGHASIHSYHLVVLVYLVSQLQLNSSQFQYNFATYTDDWYKPLIVCCFFVTYETITIAKLWNKQNLMIIGYRDNSWGECMKRGMGASMGLWFFYMGLGIPSNFINI